MSYFVDKWKRAVEVVSAERSQMPDTLRLALSSVVALLTALVLFQCISGIFLSFSYQANTRPIYDDVGLSKIPFEVTHDVIDADGDTLYHKGESCLISCDLNRLMDGPPPVVRYPLNDTSAFKLTIEDKDERTPAPELSAAWLSVYHSQSHEIPMGLQLRSLHHWTSFALMGTLMLLIVLLLVWRVYRYVSMKWWWAFLTASLLIFAISWIGSVLPWDLRGQSALSIVASFVDDYVPIVGHWLSEFLNFKGSSGDLRLQHAFVLHAIILPLLILALLRSSKVSIQRVEQSDKSPTVSSALHWQSIGVRFVLLVLIALALLWPMQTRLFTHTSYRFDHHLRPEWYLAAPFYLLNNLPSDLVALLLGVWWLGVFGMGGMDKFVRGAKKQATITFAMAAAVLIVYVLSWNK